VLGPADLLQFYQVWSETDVILQESSIRTVIYLVNVLQVVFNWFFFLSLLSNQYVPSTLYFHLAVANT
jgi:hypothetical protein